MKLKHTIGILAGLITSANAADITKSATGTDLNDGASWGGATPGSGDTALWSSGSLGAGLSLGTSTSWGGIRVTDAASDVSISGSGTLTLGSAGIHLASTTVNTSISSNVVIGASQAWKADPSRNLSITGNVSGSGDLTFGANPVTLTSTTFLTLSNQTLFTSQSLGTITNGGGLMGGAWVNSGAPLAANAYQFSNSGSVATYWLKILDGGFTKALKVELSQSGGDIVGRSLQAKYISGADLSFDFETGGTAGTVATSQGAGGYGGHTTTVAVGTIASGTVALSASNSYTGATNILSGSLSASGGNAIPDTSAVNLAGIGTLQLAASETVGSHTGTGTVNLGANTLSTGADNSSYSFGGTISGSGSLRKVGTGTYTPTTNASNSGVTTISAGTIVANSSASVGTAASVTMNDASTGANNTSLMLSGNNTNFNKNIDVTANGTGQAILGSVDDSTNNMTFSGVVTMNNATTFVGGTTDRTTFDGKLTGNVGTLTVSGGKRVVITNTTNDFTGDIVVTGAGTVFQTDVVTNAGEQIPNGSALTVDSGAIFKLAAQGGSVETISELNGAGIVRRHEGVGGTQTLRVGFDGGNGNFSGTLQNGAGPLALTKIGTGVQTLSGTNTYTGATSVSAGTLLVTGALGNTAVTVGSAGAIGGTGTLGGTLTFDAGANLDLTGATLGLTSTNILTVATGMSITLTDFSFSDIIGWDAANASNGTYTLINGGGTVTFNGSTPTMATPFDFGNGKMGYFQQGSLQAVIIPEPSSFLLGALGALGLASRRRR